MIRGSIRRDLIRFLFFSVYSDVPEALAIWTKTKRIAVYSRGTVESQKLFLKHTTEGDLSGHISNYFDLSVGDKQDDASYVKIAEQLSITPEELIYINDEIDGKLVTDSEFKLRTL